MTDAVLDGFEGPSFVSTDLEATRRFWVDYLGGILIDDGADDGARPCRVLLGGVVLDFWRAREGEEPHPGGPNHQHYAFDIEPEEWDLWAQRAKEWGHHSLRVTAHAAIHGLSMFFDDPDGYHMELAAHYVNAEDMEEAKRVRADLIDELVAVPPRTDPPGRSTPATVGLLSHFTNSAPDLAAAEHFWIDFLGGELYTTSAAIHQLVLAGITIDLFAQRPNGPVVPPAPGAIRQQYRFRVSPDNLGSWITRAEEWGVRMTMLSDEPLERLTLIAYGAGSYHAALVSHYDSVEALRADVELYRERVARLDAIAEPFTSLTGPAVLAGAR